MTQVDFSMLYAAADFILANSTEGERLTIFCEMTKGRKNKGLRDNCRVSFWDKKINRKMFKKILKTFK